MGRTCDLAEHWILKSRFRDQRHIPGSDIVLIIVKAVGIHKMRPLAADLFRFLIHQVCKFFDTAACMLRYTIAGFICGFQHDTVQNVHERDLLAGLDADVSASRLDAVYGMSGEFDRGVQIIVIFYRHQGRKNLSDAGRIAFLVNVFCI